MTGINKQQFIKGSIWKIIEQFSVKGISLLFSIVLTRLLTPEAYGLIALTVVFINLSDILIDGGFSTALIRKKEVDDYDFSCVMFVSFSIAIVLYSLIFIGAPFISRYYETAQLTSVLRVIGLILFIQAFSSVRTALVNRNMQFKLLFKCNFTGTVISGMVGIICALSGLGVWALVVQRLLQLGVSTLLLLLKINWKFRFRIKIDRLKEIFSFSIGVVSSSLINYLGSSIYSLVVGKRYSVTDLGYSDKGAQLPTQISLYTFGAMSSVLLPTLSSYQSDLEKIKQITRKVVQMTSYLITPLMVGLALTSREVIILLFTDTWLPAVPIMQANCIYYFATPFMLIFVQVFFALGRSSLRVKTEFIRMMLQILGIVVFGIALKCSIYQLSYVIAIVAVLSAFFTYLFAKKMIRYNLIEFICDIYKPIIASAIMGFSIYLCDIVLNNYIVNSNILLFICKLIVGSLIYILMSAVMKISGFVELKRLIEETKQKNE